MVILNIQFVPLSVLQADAKRVTQARLERSTAIQWNQNEGHWIVFNRLYNWNPLVADAQKLGLYLMWKNRVATTGIAKETARGHVYAVRIFY